MVVSQNLPSERATSTKIYAIKTVTKNKCVHASFVPLYIIKIKRQICPRPNIAGRFELHT